MSGSADPQRRVGVFGGAFDPPHIAHTALARAALEQLALDELRIIPTGEAWHKNRHLTPAAHRLEMARLAFGAMDRVVVDPRETRRSGPSYTVDTLTELRREMPTAQILLIIGEDQAAALPGWHRWREIINFATICVAARAGFAGARGTSVLLIFESVWPTTKPSHHWFLNPLRVILPTTTFIKLPDE